MNESEKNIKNDPFENPFADIILQIKEMHKDLPRFFASNPPREVVERLGLIIEEMREVAIKMQSACDDFFKENSI